MQLIWYSRLKKKQYMMIMMFMRCLLIMDKDILLSWSMQGVLQIRRVLFIRLLILVVLMICYRVLLLRVILIFQKDIMRKNL